MDLLGIAPKHEPHHIEPSRYAAQPRGEVPESTPSVASTAWGMNGSRQNGAAASSLVTRLLFLALNSVSCQSQRTAWYLAV